MGEGYLLNVGGGFGLFSCILWYTSRETPFYTNMLLTLAERPLPPHPTLSQKLISTEKLENGSIRKMAIGETLGNVSQNEK